jgi:lycopene cyclase domain-containing protein
MTTGRFAYLAHLLYGLPVLLVQLLLLKRAWGPRLRAILAAVVPPALLVTLWLVLADEVAILSGLWAFGPGKHLGLYLGHVPLEEALFFLITSLLVAFGLPLFMPRRACRAVPGGSPC